MKTKSIVILAFIICSPIVMIVVMFSGSKYPHLSSGGKITVRQALLQRWYGEVGAFVETEGYVPDSLYDICKKWVREDKYLNVPDEVYLGLGRGMFKEEEKKKLSQEEFFNEQIHFQLLKSKEGLFWVIKERGDSIMGQDSYFIDQNGFIFKATCLKQAPDIKEIYK
jgi:hypothetical protein